MLSQYNINKILIGIKQTWRNMLNPCSPQKTLFKAWGVKQTWGRNVLNGVYKIKKNYIKLMRLLSVQYDQKDNKSKR